MTIVHSMLTWNSVALDSRLLDATCGPLGAADLRPGKAPILAARIQDFLVGPKHPS